MIRNRTRAWWLDFPTAGVLLPVGRDTSRNKSPISRTLRNVVPVFSRSALGILAFAAGCSSSEHVDVPPDDGREKTTAVSSRSEALPPGATWVVADGLEIDFILSNHELLNFGLKEIEAYLSERAPHLVPHAEAISHFSAYSTVSARLLMALMEQQTGIFGKQGASTETPFGQMSTQRGFIDQMRDVSSRVSSAYYDQGDLRQVEAFSTQRALEAILPSAGERTALGQAYRKLFPGVASQRVLPA